MQRLKRVLAILVVTTGCTTAAPPIAIGQNVRPSVPRIPLPDPSIDNTPDNEFSFRLLQLEPSGVMEAYFDLIRQERGSDAIQHFWDNRRFAERVYRSEFDALTEADKTHVARQHKRFTMGIYANKNVADLLKDVRVDIGKELRHGEFSRVIVNLRREAISQPKPTVFVLMKRNGRWRIVDMSTSNGRMLLSDQLRAAYARTGASPVQYADGMVKGLPALAVKYFNN
ncbi:MAG: hypothetical protein ACYTGL_17555 [Planctomycetota bacterium]